MNIEPCPHCYRKVIPMADGKCPSCGKKTADRTGVDPTRTLISIRTGDRREGAPLVDGQRPPKLVRGRPGDGEGQEESDDDADT